MMVAQTAKRARRKLRTLLDNFPVRLREFWIKQIARRSFVYTDQFGLKSIIRPNENVFFYLKHRSHFDDLGVVRFLQRSLKPGMTVFDVGANKGEFSLYAARLVAPTGKVYAFEPVHYALDFFQENLALHPELRPVVEVHKRAVSDRDGEIVMNLFPEAFSGWNSLAASEMTYGNQTVRPVSTEKVTCVTLDSFCAQHRIEGIDLLKIDVEGYESEVIAGAAALVQQGRVGRIVFEISLAPLAAREMSALQVSRSFSDLGFRIAQILPGGELQSIERVEDFEFPFFANYVAEPR